MEHMDDAGMVAPVPLLGWRPGCRTWRHRPTRTRRRALLVVAWHGLHRPRSQQAIAAAPPLTRLAAWRVYLGLPLVGAPARPRAARRSSRASARRLRGQKLVGPMVEQAFAEFPAVAAALRVQLKLDAGSVGLVGGSVGAAVALLDLAEAQVPVQAAALVRPAVQLKRVVAANDQRHNPNYRWTMPARVVAERPDFVAQAHQIAARDPPPAVPLVTGAGDDADVGEPAERLWHTLANRYRDPWAGRLLIVPGPAQALAEESGTDLAPQTLDAARGDATVTG